MNARVTKWGHTWEPGFLSVCEFPVAHRRVSSNPVPHLLTHDLVPPRKPHPTRVNGATEGTCWAVVRTETRWCLARLCTELAHWPHAVWDVATQCPFALADQVHGLGCYVLSLPQESVLPNKSGWMNGEADLVPRLLCLKGGTLSLRPLLPAATSPPAKGQKEKS